VSWGRGPGPHSATDSRFPNADRGVCGGLGWTKAQARRSRWTEVDPMVDSGRGINAGWSVSAEVLRLLGRPGEDLVARCEAPQRHGQQTGQWQGNLLIRRSPSGVQGGPRGSIQPETTGFRFHRRPRASVAVSVCWLPTWLPARPLASVVKQRPRASAAAHTWPGTSGWGGTGITGHGERQKSGVTQALSRLVSFSILELGCNRVAVN
jgi:hypothetical protein